MTNEEINKVLSVLSEWKQNEEWFYGGIWKRYSGLVDETKLTRKKCFKILQLFKFHQIVDYTYTINTDGQINGKGYFLKDKYINKTIEEIIK